jgi:hypothetical protein
MRVFLQGMALLLSTSVVVAQDEDPHFAPWLPDEAKRELGIKLSSLIDCPHYSSNTFPLFCQAPGLTVGIKDMGERDEDYWKDRLFSTDSFDWRRRIDISSIEVVEMSWGDDVRGYANCRSWPTFDPLLEAPQIEAFCVIAGGNVSGNTRIINMTFFGDFSLDPALPADQTRFLGLVASIARDML